jgi:hypothetical protein
VCHMRSRIHASAFAGANCFSSVRALAISSVRAHARARTLENPFFTVTALADICLFVRHFLPGRAQCHAIPRSSNSRGSCVHGGARRWLLAVSQG